MRVTETYIQIIDTDHGPKLTVKPEEAKTIIDEMVGAMDENDGLEEYTFKAVSMTKEEFESLPEFLGF